MNYSGQDSVLREKTERSVVKSQQQLLADFEAVVAQHRSYLMRIAVASTRNPADAEDVVHRGLWASDEWHRVRLEGGKLLDGRGGGA